MKQILKKYTSPNETPSFTVWKKRKKLTKTDLLKKRDLQKQQSEIWKTFTKTTDEKLAVKTDLIEEQGYICCYCQDEIFLDSNTQIEHFVPRSREASLMFDYENLLACCTGGQKERTESKTNESIEATPKFCGAAKDNNLLAISPLQSDCETHFDYIIGENFEIEILGKTKDANDVILLLNLNVLHLKRLRGNVIQNLITDENGDFLDRNELLIMKNQISVLKNQKFHRYCNIIDKIIAKLV